jgi:hypothetical protein
VIFDEDYDFEGPRAPKAHLDTVLAKPVTPDLGRQALYTSLGSPCVLVAHHSPDILVPSERSLWACQTALWGVLGSHIADFPLFHHFQLLKLAPSDLYTPSFLLPLFFFVEFHFRRLKKHFDYEIPKIFILIDSVIL